MLTCLRKVCQLLFECLTATLTFLVGERPWSSLDLALKDVGHGIRCARESGSRLEVGEVALRHLEEAKDFSDAHGRPLDSSSMYGVLRQQAGLPFETDFVQKRDSGDA